MLTNEGLLRAAGRGPAAPAVLREAIATHGLPEEDDVAVAINELAVLRNEAGIDRSAAALSSVMNAYGGPYKHSMAELAQRCDEAVRGPAAVVKLLVRRKAHGSLSRAMRRRGL